MSAQSRLETAIPTAPDLAERLASCGRDDLLRHAERWVENAQIAMTCFSMNHAALQDELSFTRVELLKQVAKTQRTQDIGDHLAVIAHDLARRLSEGIQGRVLGAADADAIARLDRIMDAASD